MVQLQEELKAIEDTNTQLVGISYDSVDILKKFADSQQIGFPLLSDDESKTIHAYGIHYKDGLPHPCTYVIDQEGIVQAKLAEKGYVRRHPAKALVEAAGGVE